MLDPQEGGPPQTRERRTDARSTFFLFFFIWLFYGAFRTFNIKKFTWCSTTFWPEAPYTA